MRVVQSGPTPTAIDGGNNQQLRKFHMQRKLTWVALLAAAIHAVLLSPTAIVLASFALSPAVGATQQAESASDRCSNASLSGTYGFLHGGVDSNGAPNSAAVSQLTFDSTTGTFTGATTSSHDGVLTTFSFAGTYAVASNCTGTGTPAGANPFSFLVTPTGFLATHGVSSQGFAVKQGSPTCTIARAKGSFGLEATGVFVAGAPATGPIALIGELTLSVNASGDGIISGHVAGGDDATTFTFAEEPVSGTYSVNSDCSGTATIKPKGRSKMHFSLVVVDCGKEMLAVETDAGTVVSGTLVRRSDEMGEDRSANDSATGPGADSIVNHETGRIESAENPFAAKVLPMSAAGQNKTPTMSSE
jgi:hypothetical protein